MTTTGQDSAARAASPAGARRRTAWALAAVIPAPSVGAAMAFWVAPGLVGNACYALGKLLLYGIPIACLALGDGRDALARPRSARPLVIGAILGIGIAAVILIAARASAGALVQSSLASAVRAAGVGSPGRFLALSAYLVVVNSLLEEISFRWFLITRLRRVVPAPAAGILASLAFTAHHVVVLGAFFPWPLAATCSLGVLIGGLLWSWCFLRFASLWPGWLSHALVDAAILGVAWRVLFAR